MSVFDDEVLTMVCSAYKMETQVREGGKVEITVPIRPGVVVKVVVIAPD